MFVITSANTGTTTIGTTTAIGSWIVVCYIDVLLLPYIYCAIMPTGFSQANVLLLACPIIAVERRRKTKGLLCVGMGKAMPFAVAPVSVVEVVSTI